VDGTGDQLLVVLPLGCHGIQANIEWCPQRGDDFRLNGCAGWRDDPSVNRDIIDERGWN